jgi:glycosyltransferase involved in cell wall biosynthesis
MKIALVSDAWAPQINGVVQTLQQVCRCLENKGNKVLVIHPGLFKSIPCPSYPEIRLALFPGRRLRKMLEEFEPDHLHIATEGPLGISTRRHAQKTGMNFTTAFHTQFPEYIHKRIGLPLSISYRWMKNFHNSGSGTMVSTPTVRALLESRGFNQIRPWCRGVDTKQFNPNRREALPHPGPVFLYVGRVAIEKNIAAFLELDLPGTKIVVGDGPALEGLRAKFPDTIFPGKKRGDELAKYYASADVFVFPSRTDTFGLVMLEAMASGTPVAAFPVQGPLDVLTDPEAGVMNEDLGEACKLALGLNRDHCVDFASGFSWESCADLFNEHLVPVRG